MTSPTIEQKVYMGETIENIYRLFIQLRLLLTSPENNNEILSPVSILNELTDICNRLVDRKYHTAMDAMDISEIILKNYLLLIDTNEFIDRYLIANNNFITALYHSLSPSDIPEVINSTEGPIREKMFYRLLDQMSSSKRILSFLNNEENIQQGVMNSCRLILLLIFRVLCYTQSLGINVSIIKLKKYENIFFLPLIIFLERHFSRNKPSENEILIEPILDFLQSTSKETITIPIFINIKCPEVCLRWLSISNLKSEEYKCIINILKNISCHDDGAIILQKNNYTEIFNQFKKEILFTKIDYIVDNFLYKNLLFMMNMITFSIGNSNDIENTDDYEIIRNGLLPTIEVGLSSPSFAYSGFYTSDLLIILMKLFTNDNIMNSILQKYTISGFFTDALKKLLTDMKNILLETSLMDKKILSIIVFANIFWSISFQDQYKNALIQNIKLIGQLETCLVNNLSSSTYLSRQIFSLKRAMDGIKQNLSPSASPSTSATRMLMISYSYLDLDFYRTFYEILIKTSKFSICMEAENWKQIAQNIEQSDLILFLLSKDFSTNKSCRQEFIYALDILKKPCIPIFIDYDYQPIGWLYKRIDRLQSIRYGERDFTDRLLLTINESLSVKENSSDIKQWNDQEVKQWFRNHHLIPELDEFYQFQNGNELVLYAQAISTCPWTKEYERIRSRFEKKSKHLSPHEFLKFINALERLKRTI